MTPVYQCPRCGAPIHSNEQFCSHCGTPFNDATQIAPNPSAPPYPQGGAHARQQAAYPQPQKSGMSSTLIIILSGLVGMAIAIGGFLAYKALSGNREEAAPQDSVASHTDTIYQAVAAPQPAAPARPATTLINGGTFTYSGTIAGQRVSVFLTNTDGLVSGSYRYTKYTSDNRLSLTGAISGNTLSLYELNELGEYTGQITAAVSGSGINGTFTNIKSGKQYNVYLTQQ